ncbi:diaminohydroxyphosphoribosylaminopyrimidine deaminase [Chitinophaga sp. CF118]|uniref:bifunctional diaminohydroxyphosphoribosylaminopyrimidine deaminase/5-amino-6-(5-phosphoribosylamino)uracil reductase RibD n=1 Tax=Chitinophaga sp. CF118 TaxID=1884367 RepID=UPI0008E168C7|nr:bifunctional diaminohydroxyphosphoribosylaminopyrimidine deaminase/5-amino-6-(5-phosphoribosylamino)uracil reductase RibD [Chitinophaga sp. CF118]SFD03970.1 diaminohydroxyphosphoribosylaminopyrimidine deaminase [Chitinophaga sp. CF118]
MDSTFDEFFMQRCLQLARLGAGQVAPNPMVGAVLVHQGRIIGEGYHRLYGFAHAEVNCVQSVKPEDQHLIPAATMYVSLEPCAHHGKTPPCANLIVAQGIKEVVIGCVDTFSKVSGRGIEILKDAGITVRTAVLEQECRELNNRFFTFHEKKRPYIILKWAQSPAGYIGTIDGKPVRISNAFSDRLVHRWRSEEMSILVGTNTALMDNPRLNNRLWTGKDPIRLVIDRTLKIPRQNHLWDGSIATLFFTEHASGKDGLTETVQVDFQQPLLPQLMQQLYERHIQSVLVEGGANLLQHFITTELWDEARVITGTNLFPGGLPVPAMPHAELTGQTDLEGDRILYYRRKPTV